MHFHNYIFLQSKNSLQELSHKELESYKKEFLEMLLKADDVSTNTYATLGLKANTNILMWLQAEKVESIQNLLNNLMHTCLGKHINITYTLFGMTRPSQYSHNASMLEDTNYKGGAYLIIYPFTKTQSWYMLDSKARKELMKGHIEIGRNYPQIPQILLYSYGVDDNEFIVSYETDDLSMFQSLVIDLRSDKVREYTLKDTPIFTCVYKTTQEALNFL